MKDVKLYLALIVSVLAMFLRVDIKALDPVETQLQAAAGIGIIAFIQTFLGGKELVKQPAKVDTFLESGWGRFLMLYLTMFAMTSDFELAFFVAAAYLIFLQIFRTPEERKETPFLI